MKEENCPCCPNHCSKDSLGCGQGRDYFSNNLEPKTLKEQVVSDIRKCGHLLHHNKDIDTNSILMVYSEEELNILHELLSKFYNNLK